MDYEKFEYYLSPPRVGRYLMACDYSKTKARELYRVNLNVSQSFYPVLNLFEVFFRNVCDYQLAIHFNNSEWIMTERSGFMDDISLRQSKFFLKSSVSKAERKIRSKKGIVTSGKIVAEQPFGFWTSLFETHHYRLIAGTVIHCFPNKPSYVNRTVLSNKLNRIRDFRNRIYHNEPICFSGLCIDFSYAETIKQDIDELIKWIDPDLCEYMKQYNGLE